MNAKTLTQIIDFGNSSIKRWRVRILVVLAILFGGGVRAFANGIEFRTGTWEEIVAMARQENKPIFVDAYTPWCGPCKLMAKNIFSDEEVGDFYNNHFICWKADMSDSVNAAFGSSNSISAYPTLLYFTSNAETIFQYVGYKDKQNFLATGDDALHNSDFVRSTAELRLAYFNCTEDKHLLYQYYTILKDSGRAADSVGWAALRLMEPEDLKNDTAFRIWFELDQRTRSPLVDYFLENRSWFQSTYGRMAEQKPRYIIAYNVDEARKNSDTALLLEVENFIRKSYCGDEQESMITAVTKKYCRC